MATRILISLSALALSATGISSAAMAQMTIEPMSKTVRYSDLDLATEAGQKALRKRINSAVGYVCGTTTPQQAELYNFWKQCQAQATERAMRKADNAIAAQNGNRKLAANERVAARR
jgi:UrcA family protein